MISPDLTLILGPQTRLGMALNTAVRENREAIGALGVDVYPSRFGDKAIRDVLDGAAPDGIKDALSIGAGRPVVLTATKGLATPAGTVRSREILPDAEAYLAAWSHLVGHIETRVVLCIDPLPDFLFAMNHDAANAAVQATPWDALYETSWADVLTEIADALPRASILALSTRGAFLSAETALPMMFGAGALALSPDTFRASLVGATGEEMPHGVTSLSAWLDAAYIRPPQSWLSEILGMDAVTASLLQERFREDLRSIRAMRRVQLL